MFIFMNVFTVLLITQNLYVYTRMLTCFFYYFSPCYAPFILFFVLLVCKACFPTFFLSSMHTSMADPIYSSSLFLPDSRLKYVFRFLNFFLQFINVSYINQTFFFYHIFFILISRELYSQFFSVTHSFPCPIFSF